MKIKTKISKKLKFFINKYVILSFLFIIWMIFFDQNSLIVHYDLDKKINSLKTDYNFYLARLKNEKENIKKIETNLTEIEKIGREKYLLRKENEDIFIVKKEIIK